MIGENQQYNAQIDSYFDDSMSSDEKKSFLNELENNAELKKEFSLQVELQQAISDSGYDKVNEIIAEVLNPDIDNKKDTKSRVYQILKYAAVISAILICTFLLSLFFKTDNSAVTLMAQHFEPYPAYNTFRGETNNEELIESAFRNYELKKYQEAEVNFGQLIDGEPTNMAFVFYKANALMAYGDYKAAIPLLKSVVESENDLLGEQANWYLALSYLGNNNIEEARSLFLTIKQNENSKYSTSASELLDEI